MRGLPDRLPRSPILKSEKTPSIEHAENQTLPRDADGFHQRLERPVHEFEGRDHDHKIDTLVRKGERLGIASQAGWALKAAGFHQHGPGEVKPDDIKPSLGQPSAEVAGPAADLQRGPRFREVSQELPEQTFL